jgi:hypothetical protein
MLSSSEGMDVPVRNGLTGWFRVEFRRSGGGGAFRFETHGKANLETFIQVLRVLGRTQYLFMLFPAPVVNRPSVEECLKKLTPTKLAV